MSPWPLRLLAATSALALCLADAQAQSPISRPSPTAGSIVATKGGEEMRFVREEDWRAAQVRQDVIGGDTLRTNAIGNLAILFADQTQIRVGRNSTLVVREVASSHGNTLLDLQSGQVWARAARDGTGVDVKTPAAVAAIRGTDWSLSVDGSGRTSLIVLEGVVELKNAHGSVTVRRGEGAVAAIGQTPTKFLLAQPNDREQMLFYLTLRDALTWLPATPLTGSAHQTERARIEGIPAGARSAEDWLIRAEVALDLDGDEAAAAALAEARRRPLTASQRARADLVEGLIAGSQRRWSEAAALLARAERGIDPKRRVTAAYGRYIAASLAEPDRILPEPRIGANSPEAALARIFIAGFKQDVTAAAALATEAEKRFPHHPRLAVFSSQLALTLDRRDQMRASLERVRAVDPNDHLVLAMSGRIKADVDSDRMGALADLRQAVAIAPGSAVIWNELGMLYSELDADLEAEAAFRRAIEVDPHDPVAYGNLAIHLLEQSRVEEAGALIDKALDIDPDFHVAYIARGRYLLQKGDMAGAIESILAGSAANPAYSNGLLAAAIAYYQNGEIELADQALDNADRLDPNDPVTAIVRTAVALDQYRADDAVRFAREAVKRSRARGGDYAGLSANRQSGSYPAEAYRFIGLHEWGRFYGDRTFDPFAASSYFDQAASQRPHVVLEEPSVDAINDPTVDLTYLNLLLQGLFLDPLAVGGRIGRIDILRRPFLDTEFGGAIVNRDGRLGWKADVNASGFVNNPVPTSFTLNASRTRSDERNILLRDEVDSGALFIGMAPSAADRFLVFGTAAETRPGLVPLALPPVQAFDRSDSIALQAGAGWSHTFGYQNVLTAALFYNRGKERRSQSGSEAGAIAADPVIFGFPEPLGVAIPYNYQALQDTRRRSHVDGTVAALGHTLGFGDATLRYGIEGQKGEMKVDDLSASTGLFMESAPRPFLGLLDFILSNSERSRLDSSFEAVRGYADIFWRPSDSFELQAGGQYAFYDVETQGTVTTRSSLDFLRLTAPFDRAATETRFVSTEQDSSKFDPRVGAAFSPVEGHWLRAAYRYDTQFPLGLTLSPLSTVGLIPNELPTTLGSRTETLAFRWDAEWSPHVFTAVEYQRQDVEGLDLPILNTLGTLALERGRIEHISATANIWLGHGIGLFGTIGAAETENLSDGVYHGQPIPFVAKRFARAGLTFVHPSRIKFTLAHSFLGDITGDLAGQSLKDYWATDASLTWETPDRRLLVGLTALNLFDEDYRFSPNVQGPGRTFAASIKARF